MFGKRDLEWVFKRGSASS